MTQSHNGSPYDQKQPACQIRHGDITLPGNKITLERKSAQVKSTLEPDLMFMNKANVGQQHTIVEFGECAEAQGQ